METFLPPSFTEENREVTVHVIGCGGIGSNLVYNIWRDRHAIGKHLVLALYDGDVVEKKNTTRQNFSMSDVGKPKVIALAERYGDDLTIEASTMFYDPNAQLSKNVTLFDLVTDDDVIFIGVDNVKTRIDIYEAVRKRVLETGTGPLIIDAGNHYDSGNVFVIADLDSLNARLMDYEQLYKEEQVKAPYELKCGEIIEETDPGFVQIYSTNMMAALLGSMLLAKVVEGSISGFAALANGVYFTGITSSLATKELG